MTLEMHPQRWGDPDHASALPEATRALVEAFLGAHDTPATTAVKLPPCALADAVLDELRVELGDESVLSDDSTRRLRTRGKSTPDLLRARGGDLTDAPDAVIRPRSHSEVEAVIAWAVKHHVALVPFGGGTSVTGGLAARRDGYAGLVSLDLVLLDRLLEVDRISMTATFQPGVRGPVAEALLAEHGLTLGHFPQSFEFASIGGFAATRSSGQSSAGFGRFDEMVVRLRVATPRGEIVAGNSPANAAGPDVREMLLGSEGTLGVLTEITVRVRERTAEKVYEAWSFDSFEAGSEAMRYLVQHELRPTVLRLSDETETMINLASQSAVGGESAPGALMIIGYETPGAMRSRPLIAEALSHRGATALGEERGAAWAEGRFHAPYLRDALLDVGVLVETIETATFWSNRAELYAAVKEALESKLAGAIVMCHISHVYETGCSLYFTVAAPQAADPLAQWQAAKAAAGDAMLNAGATITHHHAVGTDHQPWLRREIGEVGIAMLQGLKAALDPTGVLNPGVLMG